MFEEYRTSLANSFEVADYYGEWSARLKKEIDSMKEKKQKHEEEQKEYAAKHPFLFWFAGYQCGEWDTFNDFALRAKERNLEAVSLAIEEALYNSRNGIELTRVHMDFFKIEE